MGIFYLNHNVLELQRSDQNLITKLKEITKINQYLDSQSFNMYVYSNLWNIPVLGGTLKSFLYRANRDEVSVVLLTLMNTGPFYYENSVVANLTITPNINGVSSFANKLLEICFKDKHSLVTSISDETYLINRSYEVSSGIITHEIVNHIGIEDLTTYFEQQFNPINIKDVFEKIEEQNYNIVILEDAKKSAQQHNFLGRFIEIYKVIIALEDIELSMLREGVPAAERKKIFFEQTGFEISSESDKTLNIRKYKREREFIIPVAGKVLFDWHIKIGNSTRIHYYIDKQNYKIYIGHCGKHLGTASYNS
ncbi:hypothetical protein KQ41_02375 [Lysinibacillus fusiformis]|uniref:hypothetical protein n=1 Tax=Lysinibacillus fusiformis TaxID=28031 RepID=UPI000503CD44|nr:hypothetical protein [Lysinibacillus fusiformis]KGA84645.1 hypothetical protein KQ41_02375 [Lysinibacillus fusiformis]